MRVRWEMKRYDPDHPHLDKAMLIGRVGGHVASAGGWFWSNRQEKRYLFKKVRMMLERSIALWAAEL